MLLEEILDSAADIICLQEVNRYGESLVMRLALVHCHAGQFSQLAVHHFLSIKCDQCRGLLQASAAEGWLHRRVLAKSLLASRAVRLPLRWLHPLLQDRPI